MPEPINLHRNEPPALMEKASQQTGVEKAMQDINARLALNGLKAELPKTISEQENEVKNLLITKTLKDAIEKGQYKSGIEVKYIEKGVFAVISNKTGNISIYVDSEGKTIYSISGQRDGDPFIEKVFKDMGIVEVIDSLDKKMYYIDGYKNLPDGTKEPILGEQVDKKSKEYYEIWKNIKFYGDVYAKLHMLKTKMEFDDKLLTYFIVSGTFKFEDFELFKQKGLMNESQYINGLQELKQVIISQCSDIRLINLGIGIKESDVKKYLEKGYIDGELAKKCYESLPLEMKDLSKK